MAMAVKIAVIWLSQNKKAHTPSMTDGGEVSDQSIIKKIYRMKGSLSSPTEYTLAV